MAGRKPQSMIEECLVVEFTATGDDCPLADATRTHGATVSCRPPQLRRDDTALLRFSTDRITQSSAENGPHSQKNETVGSFLDVDERVRYLHATRSEETTAYRCLSLDPCVVHELTDAGFLVDDIRYREGTERYTGAVVGHDVLDGVLTAADETVGVSLERVYPLGANEGEPIERGWDLTPAQEAALRTAHKMGYFGVPKGATAEEVATELGIGASAFLERLYRGQSALFEQLFD